MGTSLNGLTPGATYSGLIKTTDNAAISGTAKILTDGASNDLPVEVSTSGVNFTGTLSQSGTAVPTAAQVNAKQDTLVSGTNIKTINGTSVLSSGNIVTPSPAGSTGQVQFNNAGAFGAYAPGGLKFNRWRQLTASTRNPPGLRAILRMVIYVTACRNRESS